MAQLTEPLVRDILENGAGVTRWEVEQLCHAWLSAQTGEAVAMVCLRGETFAHGLITELVIQHAEGVEFPIGTKFYAHPPAADFRAVVDCLRAIVENRSRCFIPTSEPDMPTFNWDEKAAAALASVAGK